MRYITGPGSYLVAVSFGADIECDGSDCKEYTGAVPAGYKSLEAWYLAECEQLWKWRVLGDSMVYDANATPPEEPEEPAEPEEDFVDVVVEYGIEGGWHYRKWRSGYCELWAKTNVVPPSSIQAGSNYYSDVCTLGLPFRVWGGVVTGSAHFLHWVSNAEVWEDGMTVGFRLMRSTGVYTDAEVPVQLHVQGQWIDGVLPSGFTRIEYIESTGTQYLNSGYSAPDGFVAEIVFEYTGSLDGCIIGAQDSAEPYGRNYVSTQGGGQWVLGAGDADLSTGVYASLNTKHTIRASTVKGDAYLEVDGTRLGASADSSYRSETKLYLFTSYWAQRNGYATAQGRLYSAKIYDPDGTLVRDFVPVQKDGRAGLYDFVTGWFYGYVGSEGDFVGGPVLTASN